jgi:hypothetical protein
MTFARPSRLRRSGRSQFSSATGVASMTSKLKLLSASSGFGLMLAFASPAYAQNTDANTLIQNTVNVNYQVGGVAQTQINAVNEFRVDRKILFSVAEKTTVGTTSVTSGQARTIRSISRWRRPIRPVPASVAVVAQTISTSRTLNMLSISMATVSWTVAKYLDLLSL